MISRILFLALVALGFAAAQPTTVRIGVLGLFEPGELMLRGLDGGPLRLPGMLSVEGRRAVKFSARDDQVLIDIDGLTRSSDRFAFEQPAAFELSVPGRLSRRYFGGLEITAASDLLQAIVVMDLETAVAAAVAGEADLDGPEAALIAQAVASRSYLASGARHESFGFCDTTHCQYLTDSFEPRARQSAFASRGVLLWADGRILRALFTRSCSGKTVTPPEVGLPGGPGYQSAECPICRTRPVAWARRHSAVDIAALLVDHTEQARLAVVRRLGWDAVPSNTYEIEINGDVVAIHGLGEGHGIGLCQRGANGLSRQGASWRDILHRYFPAAQIR